MKIENGIPILDVPLTQIERDIKHLKVALNALQTLTEELVKMENSGASPRIMMDKCVWPILQEASRRFSILEEGKDIEENDFTFVIKNESMSI